MENEWSVTVPIELAEELAQSFNNGPILNDSGQRMLTEELVARLNGLKIEVFSNEHPPPHFRVKYAGETANYEISDCAQLNGDLKKWKKNIIQWHRNNKYRLIQVWDETRPTDCPVGEYNISAGEAAEVSEQLKQPNCNLDEEFWKSKLNAASGSS